MSAPEGLYLLGLLLAVTSGVMQPPEVRFVRRSLAVQQGLADAIPMEKVYVFDKGFFQDAEDSVVGGTRVKMKNGFILVQSLVAQELFAPEVYLRHSDRSLGSDERGIYLSHEAYPD